MKPGVRQRARAAALALALACVGAPTPADDALPRDQAGAERALARTRTVIEALQREMRAADRDRSEALRALERHERAIAGIAGELRRLEAERGKLTAELARLRATSAEVRAEIGGERALLGRHVRVAYALGREQRLKLLLNGEHPDEVARLLRYHDYVTRERRARIRRLGDAIARLEAVDRTVAAESARLDQVAAERERRRAALLAERDRRASALAGIERELADGKLRLKALESDRERLATLVERLRRALDDIPADAEPPRSFRSLRGRLPWPVQGSLTKRFGTPRDDADLSWQGVVLEAPAGRDVRAVAHGRVVFADWLRGFGLLVILDHGNGYMSLYGHNQSLLREPGEWVGAGDPVATVGDSGGHARSGLYFEIRRDGRPEDPARWCSAAARFRAAL